MHFKIYPTVDFYPGDLGFRNISHLSSFKKHFPLFLIYVFTFISQ